MTEKMIVRRGWFYQLIRTLAIIELFWFMAVVVDLLLHPLAVGLNGDPALLRLLNALVTAPLILAVGVLIVRRTGGNLIGWLLLLWGAIIGAGEVGRDAFGGYAAELNLLTNGLWPVLWAIPLLFPDGQPYPRRLGLLVEGIITASILLITAGNFGQQQFSIADFPLRAGTPNRFFVPFFQPLTQLPGYLFLVPVTVLALSLVISIALRFRASRGRERQQMKYMLGSVVVLIIIAVISSPVGLTQNDQTAQTGWRLVLHAALSIVISLIPVAGIGLAILRHRLYDIDIIIRRTLVYSILTVILLAVYLGAVVLAQQVIRALTGQTSDLAIVISTLAVAGLFAPLRSLIQSIIDRRLYRQHYDAGKALAQFAATTRDQVDLNQLSTALTDVVQETVQPARLSLWLNDKMSDFPKRSRWAAQKSDVSTL